MSDIRQDIEKLRVLGVDMAAVDAIEADRLAVDRQLVEARRALAALRPSSKDFGTAMQELSGRINALEVTLAGCADDLAAAVEAAKTAAIERSGALEDMARQMREYRQTAVLSMAAAANAIVAEHALAEQATELFGSVAGWIQERRGEPGGPPYLQAPGGFGRSATWPAAVKSYFDRFARLRCASSPPAGDELNWFNRKG